MTVQSRVENRLNSQFQVIQVPPNQQDDHQSLAKAIAAIALERRYRQAHLPVPNQVTQTVRRCRKEVEAKLLP